MNWEYLMFLLSFIWAVLTGQAMVTETSSLSSDNPAPYSETRYEWECGTTDIETCFVVIVDGEIVRAGP